MYSRLNRKTTVKNIVSSVPRRLVRPVYVFALVMAVAGLLGSNSYFAFASTKSSQPSVATNSQLQVIAPATGSYVQKKTTLVARVDGASTNDYHLFWYVDNGTWNWMDASPNGANSKQADIDVSGWNWHAPSNNYKIDFVAVMQKNGQRIYGSTTIVVGSQASSLTPVAPLTTISPTPTTTTTTTSPTTTSATLAPPTTSSGTSSASTATQPASPTQTTTTPTTTTPTTTQSTATATTATSTAFDGLYANPNSNAAREAASSGDATTKRVMTKLAAQPSAFWFGDWNGNVQSDVSSVVSAGAAAHKMPVLVAYNIPQRDCGSYSAGGAATTGNYRTWIENFANGIGSGSALVILEPDALAQMGCLSSADQSVRNNLLSYAVTTLKSKPGVKVYLDAGNPTWIGASDMATRLKGANIAAADGFSANVSNFQTTAANISYGKNVSAGTGGKHFVIDTSRNGNGFSGEWCNPSGRALGAAPTNATGDSLVDYLLWIKTPGESDGSCNGGPTAGAWWPSYATTLGVNAGW